MLRCSPFLLDSEHPWISTLFCNSVLHAGTLGFSPFHSLLFAIVVSYFVAATWTFLMDVTTLSNVYVTWPLSLSLSWRQYVNLLDRRSVTLGFIMFLLLFASDVLKLERLVLLLPSPLLSFVQHPWWVVWWEVAQNICLWKNLSQCSYAYSLTLLIL